MLYKATEYADRPTDIRRQNGRDVHIKLPCSHASDTLFAYANKFKRNHLIELIRNQIIALAHLKWTVRFGWVKGHARIEGNELVDRLAKEATVEDGPVVYDKMPKEVILTQQKETGLHMWQRQ